MLGIQSENESFDVWRAAIAGVILNVFMFLYNYVAVPIIWIVLRPLSYLPDYLSYPIVYLIMVPLFATLFIPGILYYFSNKEISLSQSASLGGISVASIYVVRELTNWAEDIGLFGGAYYGGNISLAEALIYIVGIIIVAQIINYFQIIGAARYSV